MSTDGVFPVAEGAVKVLICGTWDASYLALIPQKPAAFNGGPPM
jgi:hypothetical protein